MSTPTLSNDANTRTVQRALESAKEYLAKGLAPNAKRDLDRAQSYLAKVPSEDAEHLRAECERLAAGVAQAEQEAALARVMTQVERQLRYAREAAGKQRASDLARYCESARREIAKLPEERRAEQEALVAAIEGAGDQAAAQALAAQRAREQERAERSASEAASRAAAPATATQPQPTPPPAAAGLNPNLARMIERTIRSAREHLQRANPDRANHDAARAREDVLTKIPAEHQAPLLAELDALQAEVEEGLRRVRAETLLRACRSCFERCTSLLEETRRHTVDLPGQIDHELERLGELVDKDGDCLTEAARAEVQGRFPELRAAAAEAVVTLLAVQAGGQLDRYEGALSGEVQVRYRDELDGYRRNATEAVERVPASSPRRGELAARLAGLDQRMLTQRAAEDKDATVQAVHTYWEGLQRSADFAGYADEPGHGYADWRATRQLALVKTERAARTASDFLASEQVQAALQAGFATEVAASVDAAREVQAQALAKLAQVTQALAAAADRGDRPADLAQSLRGVVEHLRRFDDPQAILAPAVAALSETAQALERSLEAQAAETEAKRQAAAQAAAALWPGVLAGVAVEELDPSAALADPDAWRGRRVRFEGQANRMGWDFEVAGNAFIARVRGIPVAATLTPELKQALQAMQQALGCERQGQEFEDLIVELDGKGKVQPIRWNHQQDRWDYQSAEEAVYAKVVAFRAGPFAAGPDGARSAS